jgi:hypothetical protein
LYVGALLGIHAVIEIVDTLWIFSSSEEIKSNQTDKASLYSTPARNPPFQSHDFIVFLRLFSHYITGAFEAFFWRAKV